ncbi:MAG: phosphotransferase [Actinobacteria bacterium]|nr:phosphotransferase [Actinomycetota bacterium]
MRDVAARAAAATIAWSLEEVEALGGGEVALVCGARQGGREVVLKLQPRGHEEERSLAGEAVALAVWSGSGASVPLLGSRDAGLTLLLERLQPGRPLDALRVGGEGRLRTLGALVARLHAHTPSSPVAVTGLAEYCRPWRDGLAGDRTALAELDALLAGSEDEVLLHGDLHGGNALEHRGEWVAIDPHAVSGDRHADIWALIDPLSPVLQASREEVAAAVATYAGAANLDPARAARWARMRAMAEAALLERSERPSAADRAWATGLRRFAAARAD